MKTVLIIFNREFVKHKKLQSSPPQIQGKIRKKRLNRITHCVHIAL